MIQLLLMLKKYHKYTKLKGNLFEFFAQITLMLKGYHLIDKNVRGKFAEVDILSQKNNNIYLTEVKFRKNHINAPYAIHPKQLERLIKQAQEFEKKYPKARQIAIDAIFFYPKWPFISHIKNINNF